MEEDAELHEHHGEAHGGGVHGHGCSLSTRFMDMEVDGHGHGLLLAIMWMPWLGACLEWLAFRDMWWTPCRSSCRTNDWRQERPQGPGVTEDWTGPKLQTMSSSIHA